MRNDANQHRYPRRPLADAWPGAEYVADWEDEGRDRGRYFSHAPIEMEGVRLTIQGIQYARGTTGRSIKIRLDDELQTGGDDLDGAGGAAVSGDAAEPRRHLRHPGRSAAMTDLHIERRELPPIPHIDTDVVDMIDPYAVVTCGDIVGKVERYCYWHPNDEHPLDIVFEAVIDGVPDTCGVAAVVMSQPSALHELAAVCGQLALLLEEAKTRGDLVRGFFLDGNQTETLSV